ncbi:hypothetical protein B0A48_11186 [Cryoendolithus antarcticus]|uniref:Uncharacterized protein n=1 Tax=Cryoendolithus antarcticus TaxID=1507870 RepID=A0A1V8SUR1_9PEZI|nr:hypothetical protein B0A48_11186 [Cryoendolithus antarcticus]
MDLPPEIRVRVYELAMHGLQLEDRSKLPALLQVSRQVRAEATPEYCSLVTVVLRLQEREDFAPQATSASSLIWLLLEEGNFLCHIRHFRIILATDEQDRHGDDYKPYSTAELFALLETRSASDLRDGLIGLLQLQDRGAAQITTQATQLMDLPTGIRIRIYALALSDEYLSLPPITPALLQSSGLIRRESLATYYATAQVQLSFTVREDHPRTEEVHASTGTRRLWDILSEKAVLPYVRRFKIDMKYVGEIGQIWNIRCQLSIQ